MAHAKGVLPRGSDREVLYKNPRTCGYFIAVKLDPAIDRARAEVLFGQISGLVDQLVERLPATGDEPEGDKIAAVAVGLGPSLFILNGAPRFSAPIEPPAAFAGDSSRPLPNQTPPLSGVPVIDAELFFYVASTFEARVNAFVAQLAALKPDVASIVMDRGFQRVDGTEPFGYADGLRNIKASDRPHFVFVDQGDRELEEPPWADGGTYMAFLRILQRPDQFAALPDDAARDQTIGRQKDGTRLDLVGQNIAPRDEAATPPPALPPTAHVGKAGPRADHDDNQIFRRGLPFMETTSDGQLRVGLNFCSFQSSPERFDVIFNDWMMNPHFAAEGDGVDALIDPSRQLAVIEKVGFFFVPPHNDAGLAAAVLATTAEASQPQSGKLVVRKRVVDPSDASRRFERRGFQFQVLDAQQQPIAGSQFATDSTGRGICPVELPLNQSYTLQELASPVPSVQLTSTAFTMDRPHKEVALVNQVTQSNMPYGGSH
jgi:Dyp-type peroxidase family